MRGSSCNWEYYERMLRMQGSGDDDQGGQQPPPWKEPAPEKPEGDQGENEPKKQ